MTSLFCTFKAQRCSVCLRFREIHNKCACQLIHLHLSLFLLEKLTALLCGNQSAPHPLHRLLAECRDRGVTINIMSQYMLFFSVL